MTIQTLERPTQRDYQVRASSLKAGDTIELGGVAVDLAAVFTGETAVLLYPRHIPGAEWPLGIHEYVAVLH